MNNGRASSSKRTKNLNMRYFLSPTESKRGTFILSIVPPNIWSRIFIKPLQGKKFLQFIKLITNLQDWNLSWPKECVGNQFFFILYKLSNVWIPVTLNSCFISNTQMDYFLFNIDYSAFTIWHLFTISIDKWNFLLAKPWELLTIIIQSNSSIYCLLNSVTTYSS